LLKRYAQLHHAACLCSIVQAVDSLVESLQYGDDEGEEEEEGDSDATDKAAGPAARTTAAAAAAAPVSLQELRAALLSADLRKTGAGCLPDDVNRAHSSSIKGPLVLQVRCCLGCCLIA
jgi:hypothetical protein